MGQHPGHPQEHEIEPRTRHVAGDRRPKGTTPARYSIFRQPASCRPPAPYCRHRVPEAQGRRLPRRLLLAWLPTAPHCSPNQRPLLVGQGSGQPHPRHRDHGTLARRGMDRPPLLGARIFAGHRCRRGAMGHASTLGASECCRAASAKSRRSRAKSGCRPALGRHFESSATDELEFSAVCREHLLSRSARPCSRTHDGGAR